MKLLLITLLALSSVSYADLLEEIKEINTSSDSSKITTFKLTEIGKSMYMIADISEPDGVVGIYMSCKPQINRATDDSVTLEYGMLIKNTVAFDYPLLYNKSDVNFSPSSSPFNKDTYGKDYLGSNHPKMKNSIIGASFSISDAFFSRLPENYTFQLSGIARLHPPTPGALIKKEFSYEITIKNTRNAIKQLTKSCASKGLALLQQKESRIMENKEATEKTLAAQQEENNKLDDLIDKERELVAKRQELARSKIELAKKKRKLEEYKNLNYSDSFFAYLDRDVIVCRSPELLDKQLASIISGSNALLHGCVPLDRRERIEVINFEPNTLSKIKIFSFNDHYFVLSNQITF